MVGYVPFYEHHHRHRPTTTGTPSTGQRVWPWDDMLFESCSEMPNIGMVVFLYGVSGTFSLHVFFCTNSSALAERYRNGFSVAITREREAKMIFTMLVIDRKSVCRVV